MSIKILYWFFILLAMGYYLTKGKKPVERFDINNVMPEPVPLFPVNKGTHGSYLVNRLFNQENPTIFFDIDGVMHRNQNESFECKHHFESLIDEYPNLQFLMSSTWRHDADQDYLEAKLGPKISGRLVGATPHLAQCEYRRQREIEQSVGALGISSFVAIDDMKDLFEPNWPQLILTDKHEGFGEIEANKIRSWLNHNAK